MCAAGGPYPDQDLYWWAKRIREWLRTGRNGHFNDGLSRWKFDDKYG